jgi:hypothetical protein
MDDTTVDELILTIVRAMDSMSTYSGYGDALSPMVTINKATEQLKTRHGLNQQDINTMLNNVFNKKGGKGSKRHRKSKSHKKSKRRHRSKKTSTSIAVSRRMGALRLQLGKGQPTYDELQAEGYRLQKIIDQILAGAPQYIYNAQLGKTNAVGSHPSWKATDTIIKERLDAALMQFDQWESKRKRLIASATV